MAPSPSDGPPDNERGEGNGATTGEGWNSPSLFGKPGGTSAQRESTPQEPAKPGESEPKPGAADGSKPDRSGEMPTGSQASDEPASNTTGNQPPRSKTEHVSSANSVDRWGELPVYARDVFRAQGGDDFPAAYREFIDAYYRRLNKPR